MINNDILRRIRFTFDISDHKMIELLRLADHKVTRAEISNLLKKEEDPAFKKCNDELLAIFLNGWINKNRGKKEGQPPPEKRLTNNIILMKLKIALKLQSEDILRILKLVDYNLGKAELSAFFRKPGHKHYMKCQDQVLRNFLHGMQLEYRKG